MDNEGLDRVYFVYTTGFIAVPAVAGGVVAVTLSILSDADFECHYITGIVTQANLVILNWAGLVLIDDSGRGRTLSSAAMPFAAIAGSGQLPYPFPVPRLIRKNSSLTITFTNTPLGVATNVAISFHGLKRYPAGASEV